MINQRSIADMLVFADVEASAIQQLCNGRLGEGSGTMSYTGTAHSAGGRMSLRLLPVRGLNPGRYTLTLISGAGSHERISVLPQLDVR